jgi:hypothetical protein
MFPYFIAVETRKELIASGPYSEADFNLLAKDADVLIVVNGDRAEVANLQKYCGIDALLVATEDSMEIIPDDGSLEAVEWAGSFGGLVYSWPHGAGEALRVKDRDRPQEVYVTVGWWEAGKPKAAVWKKCPGSEAEKEARLARIRMEGHPLLYVRSYPDNPLERMRSYISEMQRRKARANGSPS